MKKLLLSLIVAGVLIGAVYGAAAQLIITAPPALGSGSAAVSASTVAVSNWNLVAADATTLESVTLSLDRSDGAGGDTPCYAAGTDVHIRLDASGGFETFNLVATDAWVTGGLDGDCDNGDADNQTFDVVDIDVESVDTLDVVINGAP